jgi:SAM-dependent methyltransferase
MDKDKQTIKDFGEQWTRYEDISGFFGSVDLLADFIAPFDVSDFKDSRVMDIGAGTGRHVKSLLEYGASHVVAVEPSKAIDVIREKVHEEQKEKVTLLNTTGDKILPTEDLDFIISVGVIHHITHPEPVIRAAYNALKPGGKLIIWLYGKEGNELYLLLVKPLRWFSSRLPHKALSLLVRLLDIPLVFYMFLCKKIPGLNLPLSDYMTTILSSLDGKKRRVVVYDQLNPAYAKYYTHLDVEKLMSHAPFETSIYHRRGYSWVAIGTKPKFAESLRTNGN